MQDGIKDCGICSLLSIIRFYGGDVSKEYLRELTSTTKDGVSMYNLLEAAKVIGFDTYGMNGEIEKIIEKFILYDRIKLSRKLDYGRYF